MTPDEFQAEAIRTLKAPYLFAPDNVLFMIGCAMAEAGEGYNHVKKVVGHGHRLDVNYVEKELGDALWYIAIALHFLGISLEEAMEANIKKLQERYPGGFDPLRSQNRDPSTGN